MPAAVGRGSLPCPSIQRLDELRPSELADRYLGMDQLIEARDLTVELGANNDSRTESCWFVLHTKSRQEKMVAADLAADGVQCYLPVIRQIRFHGRRKVQVDLPLFPGYVFYFGEIEQAYDVDRRNRVANIIKVDDQRRFESELRNIELAISKKVGLSPHPYLKEGLLVEVKTGPLRGLQGYITDRKKNDRIVLQVEAFGGAAILETDGSLLEVIE